jgi:hypothetical protein
MSSSERAGARDLNGPGSERGVLGTWWLVAPGNALRGCGAGGYHLYQPTQRAWEVDNKHNSFSTTSGLGPALRASTPRAWL